MIKTQLETRGIDDPRVLAAFRQIDRKIFVPPEAWAHAYNDHPLGIGDGQTISQPFMVAEMTQLLELEGNERVLEIGTGSGYQTAILALLADDVYTVEVIPGLSEQAQERINELELNNVHFKIANGFDGWKEFAPYNGIIVTAAPEEIPRQLLLQMADNGRMVIPVGKRYHTQSLYLVIRNGDDYKMIYKGAVAFVPMVKDNG